MSIRGWVYIFSTESMPGLLKVGYSLKDPVLRANELENAGLPHPYLVEYEVLVYEPLEIEQCTHKELKDFNEAKEWFRCSLGEAIDAIHKAIGDREILLETIKGDLESKIERAERFIALDNGTVLDINANLMWAAKDNGSNINWVNAKNYCANYRGGGYKDWRMPTLEELEGLYVNNVHEDKIDIINCLVWSSKIHGLEKLFGLGNGVKLIAKAAYFNFGDNGRYWDYQSSDEGCRALPVRSGK